MRLLGWLTALGIVTLGVGPAFAERAVEIDPNKLELEAAVKRLNPTAVIVGPQEIDAGSCGDSGRTVIRGDFDGDGSDDYAALVRLGAVRELTDPHRSWISWAGADVWLVAFLSSRAGGFRPIILGRFPRSSFPLSLTLWLQEPGGVKSWDESRGILLKMPGVGLAWCEKASQVFYWSSRARQFKEIVTGD
jgi:hypothetical protein